MLVSHGEKDPVAKAEWGRKTFEYISELGMPTDVSYVSRRHSAI